MPQGPVRLAELLLGLTAVADLGMGQPVGAATRTCRVAVGLAQALGCDDQTVSDIFYAALLQHVGCTAYSHEASLLFADEISIKRAALTTDFTKPNEVLLGYLPTIVREAPAGARLRTAANALGRSTSLVEGYSLANCEVAAAVARRLGLSLGAQGGLLDIFEWWNGKGLPRRLRGDEVSVVARVVNVAGCAALFDRLGGRDAALHAVSQRAGRLLDPGIAELLRRTAPLLLGGLDAADSEDLLDLEPRARYLSDESAIDHVLRTFGEAVDLKAPLFHGHSTGVARLSGQIATRLRFTGAETSEVVRAAHVHDLGRAAIPSAVWESAGDLSRESWSQVHLHAYHSEQILMRSRPLERVARLAGLHHERLDGSGYHRGAPKSQLPMAARVLATADVYQAMISERPYRAALTPERASRELTAMSRAGALDPDAVGALLATVDPSRRPKLPAGHGLTDRQVEVLRLVASGLSNRDIGARLTISPRTAERHVQDMYARIGVASRAAAALFAMEHGLLAGD